MKITLCGSISFLTEMERLKDELERLGHEVQLPPPKVLDASGTSIPAPTFYVERKRTTDPFSPLWQMKGRSIRLHFNKVAWADAILVCNYDKDGVHSYIGGNTFLEMGLAFWFDKPIYLLKQIPELPYKEEILAMQPILLDGDLKKITQG